MHKQHYNLTIKNSSTKQKEYLNHFLPRINFLTERIQKDCSGDARLKAEVIVFLDDISKVDVLSPDFQNDFLKEVSKAIEKEKEHFGKTPIVEELQKAKEIVESDYSS